MSRVPYIQLVHCAFPTFSLSLYRRKQQPRTAQARYMSCTIFFISLIIVYILLISFFSISSASELAENHSDDSVVVVRFLIVLVAGKISKKSPPYHIPSYFSTLLFSICCLAALCVL